MFGYAGSSRAAFPADSPEQLIRIAVPSVAGGAVVGTYGGPSALERQPEAARMTRRVLVVDDDRQMVKTIRAILDHRGWESIPAYSGEEAVADGHRSVRRSARC